MPIAILGLLLAAILAFLSDPFKGAIQGLLTRRPGLLPAVPVLLGAIFCGAAAQAGALSLPLAGAVLVYLMVPTLCARALGPGPVKQPCALDFAIIGMLWLPLEAGAGGSLVARPAQGYLHGAAYGVAILLALVLFAGYRQLPGLKYNLPRGARDCIAPVLGFAATAPVLMGLGMWLDFIPWLHAPAPADPRYLAVRSGLIFAGTALPEELLFRSLIQNFLMLRFGTGERMLLLSAAIFGCAHLDNGPQPLPNWRYAVLAAIAGYGYGKVFQKSNTVLSSAGFHTAVDAVKHFFF